MRAARKTIRPERMIDVQYEDMERDWHGTMQRVYRFLELDIEPALPAMEDYMHRARALKRRPHTYSLAEFGLAEGDVRERLDDYVRAFDVPFEGERPCSKAPRSARA